MHVDEAREGILGEVREVTFGLKTALQHAHFIGNIDQQQPARLESRGEQVHCLIGIGEVLEHVRNTDHIEKTLESLRRQLPVIDQRERCILLQQLDELRVHFGDPDLIGDGAQLMAEGTLGGSIVQRRRHLQAGPLLE